MRNFKRLPVHYGWIVLALAGMTILVSMGLGRFSFGIMIPFIRSDMQLSYTQVGYITTALFSGYLIGSLFTGSLIRRYQHRRTIVYGLLLFTAILGIFSQTHGFGWLCVLVFGLGVMIGVLNISSLGILFNWFADRKKGTALGIANSGVGIGMVCSGMFVPYMVSLYQADSGWRNATVLFFGCAAAIWLLCLLFLRNGAVDLNLPKIGTDKWEQPASRQSVQKDKSPSSLSLLRNRTFLAIGVSYFLWGFSYLIFTTFLVDYLIEGRAYSRTEAGGLFSFAGIVSIVSGFICGALSDRFGRVRVLAWIYSVQSALLLTLLVPYSYTVTGAVFLYALTLWGVPTLMMASVGDFLVPREAPVGMGILTLFFSIGQALSPLCTGWIVSVTHSYTLSFFISAAFCAAGAVLLGVIMKRKAAVEERGADSSYVQAVE